MRGESAWFGSCINFKNLNQPNTGGLFSPNVCNSWFYNEISPPEHLNAKNASAAVFNHSLCRLRR